MHKVLGLAFESCQATGLTSPFDVFNVTSSIWKHQRQEEKVLYQCKLLSREKGLVTCSNGIQVMSDYSFDDLPDADLIIIPGIHHLDIKSLLKRIPQLREEVKCLQHYVDHGVPIAANCSGVFLLAETGALNGKSATTAWWLASAFKSRYPEINHLSDTMLVHDEQLYCSGSMTANVGAMLNIVEKQVGRSLSQSAARNMLIDANLSQASPYVFMQDNTAHQDSLILAVESHLQRDVAQKFNLGDLARMFSVSKRTLSRRFIAANGINISDYQQRLRFEQTKLLLTSTSLSLEQIADRVGYASHSSLRRLFQKELGYSPSEFRKMTKQ